MTVTGPGGTLLQGVSKHSAVALVSIDPSHVLGNTNSEISYGQHRAPVAATVSLSGEIAAEIILTMLNPVAAQLGEALL